MNELKPCPFCNGRACISHRSYRTEWWYVWCTGCMIKQPEHEYQFEFEAVEAWNRRVKDENPG